MKQIYIYLLIFLPLLFITTSCEEEQDTQPIEDLFFGDGKGTTPTKKDLKVTTISVELNPSNTIKAEGEILTDYKDDELEFGFCYGIQNNPTYENDSHVEAVNVIAFPNQINFSHTIKDLNSKTQYFVRAYAKSPEGTVVYGSSKTVTTISGVPVVKLHSSSTNQETQIITFDSELIDLGGASSVRVGWVLGDANVTIPSIQSNIANITDEQISRITQPFRNASFPWFNFATFPTNQTFYIRMYAINNDNGEVAYSNTVSFMLEEETNPNSAEWFLENEQRRTDWWNSLETQWKKAFNFAINRGEVTDKPSDSDIIRIFRASVVQIIGSNGYSNIATDEYLVGDTDVMSFRVNNLSGVRSLTNMSTLVVIGNQIDNLSPISHLSNLSQLYVNKNVISNLQPISNLTNLWALNIGSNDISNLAPISTLSNLYYLVMDDIQIQDLVQIKNLTNLHILYFGGNDINNLTPLSNLNNLTNIYFANCNISDLAPISRLTNLQGLGFEENNVSSLQPISGLTNLEILGATGNNLSDLRPISNLVNLKYLTGDENNLTNLIGMENLTKLEDVRLKTGNNIPDAEIQRIQNLLGITIN